MNTRSLTQRETRNIWRILNLKALQRDEAFELHAQRVMFAVEHESLNGFVAGALSDAYRSFGHYGQTLKQRLYAYSSPLLNAAQREYFSRRIVISKHANHRLTEYFKGAVLGVNPDKSSVMEQLSRFAGVDEKAAFLIEQGEIGKAQLLLEESVIEHNDVQNAGVISQLEDIFKYTRNQDALKRFLTRLESKGVAVGENWKTLKTSLES